MRKLLTHLGTATLFLFMAVALIALQIPFSSAEDTTTSVVVPAPVCGDSLIQGAETCDDGDTDPGDGCDGSCQIEGGWNCTGEPSSCTPAAACGDGTIDAGEQCDDGGTTAGDGCDASCQIEAGWNCAAEPSECNLCGNSVIEVNEQCDDGNTTSGDGCSNICLNEGGGSSGGNDIVIAQVLVRPEQRTGTAGSNDDTDFAFSILDANTHTELYQYSSLLSASNNGLATLSIVLPSQITVGNYDASVKTKAHLTRIVQGVSLQEGDNSLNFTNQTNLATIGNVKLIAGDVNGLGANPQTLGDDVINSVDLSILLDQIGDTDPSGNTVRANLNQDSVVDLQDLNILLGNLDQTGDQ